MRVKPNIVFSGHVYHGPLAAALAKTAGARLISQLHGTEVWEPLERRYLWPLETSKLVLCVSRDTQNRYLSQVRTLNNSAVVHNTVGDQFTPGNRQQARRAFGLDNEFVILTVGRLDATIGYKGHDRVIRLLPQLRASGRKIVYLIAGTGDDRARLERIAANCGLSEQVRFLGAIADTDLPSLYRAADLFALPSTGEGFGIVFLEAMASGTPAIGLSIGGTSDALIFGELGLAVSSERFDEEISLLIGRCCQISDEDRAALSIRVKETFGHHIFLRHVQQSIDALQGLPRPLHFVDKKD